MQMSRIKFFILQGRQLWWWLVDDSGGSDDDKNLLHLFFIGRGSGQWWQLQSAKAGDCLRASCPLTLQRESLEISPVSVWFIYKRWSIGHFRLVPLTIAEDQWVASVVPTNRFAALIPLIRICVPYHRATLSIPALSTFFRLTFPKTGGSKGHRRSFHSKMSCGLVWSAVQVDANSTIGALFHISAAPVLLWLFHHGTNRHAKLKLAADFIHFHSRPSHSSPVAQ